MTPELIVALAGLVGAIAAGIASVIVALRSASKVEAVENLVKHDAVGRDDKLQQIHVLVNSRLSQALAEIADLRQHIAHSSGTLPDKALADKAAIDANIAPADPSTPAVPAPAAVNPWPPPPATGGPK